MRLHLARAAARFDAGGELVLLSDQDRSRWDREAIAASHAEAPSWQATDWPQILVLYDMLLRFNRSPVVRLNRAVALRWVGGPEAALAEVEALARDLDGYHIFHATRAELLLELGRREQARAAELRALGLTVNRAERSLLERRLTGRFRAGASE
jgi:RNA polymerase sigma-70 factor (ECF subfamily)